MTRVIVEQDEHEDLPWSILIEVNPQQRILWARTDMRSHVAEKVEQAKKYLKSIKEKGFM